ncbi:unnamed protein product, partial [Ectocarpus sp. 4 AP-2014]
MGPITSSARVHVSVAQDLGSVCALIHITHSPLSPSAPNDLFHPDASCGSAKPPPSFPCPPSQPCCRAPPPTPHLSACSSRHCRDARSIPTSACVYTSTPPMLCA